MLGVSMVAHDGEAITASATFKNTANSEQDCLSIPRERLRIALDKLWPQQAVQVAAADVTVQLGALRTLGWKEPRGVDDVVATIKPAMNLQIRGPVLQLHGVSHRQSTSIGASKLRDSLPSSWQHQRTAQSNRVASSEASHTSSSTVTICSWCEGCSEPNIPPSAEAAPTI